MKFRLIMGIIGLLVFAAACGPTPQIRSERYLADTSLISDEPCGAPCWRGITPGETTWEDALTIIEDDPGLEELQVQADEESDRIGAAWQAIDGELCCQMFTDDGETVSFIILQTTPQSTLAQVIEKYGDPDYTVAESLSSDQGIFSLFYVDVPMLVYVFVAGEEGAISETSEVVGFAYARPDLMELLIDTSELHSWEGYQSYGDYMNSDFEVTPSITLTPSE